MFSPIKTFIIYFPIQFLITVCIMLMIIGFSGYKIRKMVQLEPQKKASGLQLWLLIVVSLLLLYITVFGRRSLDYYRYNLTPFWSYSEAFIEGNRSLRHEIYVNIIMFLPIGLLSCLFFRRLGLLKAILYGLGLSICIELLQLVLRRGTFEFDDLISNTIGTFLGGLIAVICRFVRKIVFGNSK